MFNVGTYLATRIKEIGIDDYFAVPGDFNLELLDQFLKITNLKMISCCNELNAGYAADGYARIRGASAMVVTYSVGGLSAVNAIAGAYAENLPVIIISGGPNTNSVQDSEILHHTLGNENYTYVQDIFSHICIHTVFIHRPEDAPAQIDKAIEMALHYRKPVYIEIACNIFSSMVSNPHVRSFKMKKESDQKSLRASVNQAAQMLNKAKKPIIVVGSHARACQVLSDIEKFSLHTKYAISVMADAKGFINEELSTYVGVYWGPVSSPGAAAVVESSDAVVFF
jgi:pyruvate decarboxylase